MKISFKLLLFLSGILLISCNRSPDLTKDEIYKILNEIIADDSLHLYTVCWQPEKLPVSDDYGFSADDKEFINRQNRLFKDFKFSPDNLKSYRRKRKRFEYVDVDTTCIEGLLNHLSFPLISKDRNRVLIENTEDCHCDLGGQGGKYLYIKRNGHWKREKSFDQWISREMTGDKKLNYLLRIDFPTILEK